MMIKEAYMQALRKLPVSIESEEGRELIPHLFPHLRDAEIREFLGPGVDCRTIALPPLRVDGAYQLVSFCGGGLGFSKCEWCGNEFPEEKRFKLDWSDIPLPAKITDCLISYGFKFQKDPQIARDREAQRFREGYKIRAPALTHFRQGVL